MSKSRKKNGFTYLDHTADVWVHAWGTTLEAAFEQTALALMDTMLDVEEIRPTHEKKVELTEHTQGSLLVAFLSEFLYLFDVDRWVFNQINIIEIKQLEDGDYRIVALTKGEKFDLNRHTPDTEVKAITYSYLEIEEKKEYSEIKIVFDI